MTTSKTEKQVLVKPLKLDFKNYDSLTPDDMYDFHSEVQKFHFAATKEQINTSNDFINAISEIRNKLLQFPCKLQKCDFTNEKQLSLDKNVIDFKCKRKICFYNPKDKIRFLDDKEKKVDCLAKIVEDVKNIRAHLFSKETEKECHCKHCEYVAMTKSDYWEHLKIHIEENLRWDCPLCKFITQHKYHLMHHVRDHVGSVPTKSLEFVKHFLDKSDLPSKIKSPTEQLKLRNAKKRQDSHKLEKFEKFVDSKTILTL